MMSGNDEVVGLFRDPGQAQMAANALQGQGMAVVDVEALPRDAAGTHVRVRTGGHADVAQRVLLRYGAYSAGVSPAGA